MSPPQYAGVGSETALEHVFGEEYEHTPVPNVARRSVMSLATVWISFPMIITSAMTGSILVAGMGFSRALTAMVIGNLLMFAYVGLLGGLGAKHGLNFALLASRVFGRKGYALASGLLSSLLLGWYAVQTGITGNLIHSSSGTSYLVMTFIAGLLYLAVTFVGIRGLHWLGMVSVPLFLVLGTWVAIDAGGHAGWGTVFEYSGTDPASSMAFGVGLTIVISLFVDAGTVSADFNRWAKNGRDSWIATFTAFPIANCYAMLMGGIMTAAIALPAPQPFGMDNMFGYMLSQHQTWLSTVAVIFLFCSLGSVCAHCLYNSAVGWSRIVGVKMRTAAVILAAIGIAVAGTNVWALFIPWLSLLGIIVPPIGAIVMVDQYLARPGAGIDRQWRAQAFAAWAIGSVAAYVVEKRFPEFSTAVSAFVISAVVYGLIAQFSKTASIAADGA
ncbi:purine-cytosine permease family protein [Paraburkholderia rhynchosiae]|uniref:Cytosine permease n=1 Tax=Paraburkholderia rhynchosiae TaxID=487049 RepID=A0A2N7W052_9BURK|nr:cytosine permease [Paraburkholderia rhynchosiae]PMS22777.1 cytosine permease [Paraburkholderia rhynchosiae]CAB3741021.1 Cytosine permease [Paraburkholderia rhynchosiae]